MISMKWRLCVLPLLLPLAATAAEIPPLVLGPGVGVNIHFVTGHETDLDLIAAAGFQFIRMDFAWESIEKRKGEYDWKGYEELLATLDKRHVRPTFILDYSNPLYEQTVTSPNPITGAQRRSTASPQHPDSIAAFARWAAASATHFQGRHVIWEIWNEPNIHFWSPEPNAQQYADLAVATCKAVREAEPAERAEALAQAVNGHIDSSHRDPVLLCQLGPRSCPFAAG
jgi:beta-glucosidase/6-phospho-beta-glucosidase/beta-galactosidase